MAADVDFQDHLFRKLEAEIIKLECGLDNVAVYIQHRIYRGEIRSIFITTIRLDILARARKMMRSISKLRYMSI